MVNKCKMIPSEDPEFKVNVGAGGNSFHAGWFTWYGIFGTGAGCYSKNQIKLHHFNRNNV